jgi:hypothetical protein
MPDYPILVARWDEKHPATQAVCTRCEATFEWDPSEGDPVDLCSKHGNASAGECGGQIVMKYDEGMTCPNCGKLDYTMPDGLNGCCSRKCMLQAEYAEQLRRKA